MEIDYDIDYTGRVLRLEPKYYGDVIIKVRYKAFDQYGVGNKYVIEFIHGKLPMTDLRIDKYDVCEDLTKLYNSPMGKVIYGT